MRTTVLKLVAAIALLASLHAVGASGVAAQARSAPGAAAAPSRPAVLQADARWVTGGDAKSQTLFYRRWFTLSEAPASATLQVGARGSFVVYVNGTSTTAGAGESAVAGLSVTRRLRKGANLLAVEVRRGTTHPALTYRLAVKTAAGRRLDFLSDGQGRVAGTFEAGWESMAFADRRWPASKVAAAVTAAASAPRSGSGTSARPTTPTAPAVQPAAGSTVDASRIVRVWDVRATGAGGRRRAPGDRMLLSTNVASQADAETAASAGFTLLQTDSDHLAPNETSSGHWDFSAADAGRRTAVDNGFDWCYFPHYAFLPKWMRSQTDVTRLRCLEHDGTVEAYSPWDPKLLAAVGRGYERLAQQYGPGGTTRNGVAALYLGVHGDYGEAGLMMGARVADPGQAAEWKARFGDLHDHLGWWCGDKLARAAFRDAMVAKYADLDVLNAAWRTTFAKTSDVTYPLSVSDGSRRRWLDFVHWYLDSVGSVTDGVCAAARKAFPSTLLMVPAGFADENPRGGNDNSLIPKIAAKHDVDVRSTHGGFKPFAENEATMLARLACASEFYGAPFWTEPPGRITKEQQVERIFAAASHGCAGYFDWADNIRDTRDVYYKYGKYLRVEKPVADVAMLFPTTTHLLRANEAYPPVLQRGCADIRDVLDYRIVDERMVQDGALDRFRILVLWEGVIYEAETLAKLRDWVRAGGVLVAYDFGKFETVEGDQSAFKDLFGYAGSLAPTTPTRRFLAAMREGVPAKYRIDVATTEGQTFIAGDWHGAEAIGTASGRWTGALADMYLPVDPKKACSLTIRASIPIEAASRARDVLVNGQKVGEMTGSAEPYFTYHVPAAALNGRDVAIVSIRCEPWVPADLIKGSQDRRSLGVFVNYVQVEAGQVQPAIADPGAPRGRIETTIDLKRLRSEWARPVGRGWTVYYPARRSQLPGYLEVIRYLTYHLSDLDATKQDAIPIDDSWDGVYATLFADKALYYNPGSEPVTRTVALTPEQFAGHSDVRTPADFTYTLNLEANSIGAAYFTQQPAEMLLQCEKFTDLGALKPSSGADLSPGQGLTHVLVPTTGSISTRFECETAGSYRVFVRCVRRGAPATAEVLVDGAPVRGASVPSALGSATFCPGSVTLTKGVHTLTLKPLRGQDVRADFVVLTTDTNVAGYRFGVKAAVRR